MFGPPLDVVYLHGGCLRVSQRQLSWPPLERQSISLPFTPFTGNFPGEIRQRPNSAHSSFFFCVIVSICSAMLTIAGKVVDK